MQSAECFPVGEFIHDELVARRWTVHELAKRMGGDVNLNHCEVELLIYVPSPRVSLCVTTAKRLACAFGSNATTWLNLDRSWREWKAAANAAGSE